MECPVCSDGMVVLELEGVEIDHCMVCGGVWLDGGELEMLLGETASARQLLDSFQVDEHCTEDHRRCPICDKRMAKVIVGADGPRILIDKCKKDHGLWFDAGELAEVLQHGKLDPDSKILHLLKEMFTPDSEDKQAD